MCVNLHHRGFKESRRLTGQAGKKCHAPDFLLIGRGENGVHTVRLKRHFLPSNRYRLLAVDLCLNKRPTWTTQGDESERDKTWVTRGLSSCCPSPSAS